MQALAHLEPEALKLAFRGNNVGSQLRGAHHHMAPFTNREVAEERNQLGGYVDSQHTAKADVVVHEADDRTGDEPSALHSRQQESIGVHEAALRREFLNEGSDGDRKSVV